MGDVAQKAIGVVAATLSQVAPELVAGIGAGRAAHHQLRVLHLVTGKHRHPLPVATGQQLDLLDQIRPIAGRTQVVQHHHAGVTQHVVHIKIGRRGLAQPHQVGQAHRGEISGQALNRVRQQRQRGVGRAQHNDVRR